MTHEDWKEANGLANAADIDLKSEFFSSSNELCTTCGEVPYKHMWYLAAELNGDGWVHHYTCPFCNQGIVVYYGDHMGGQFDDAYAIDTWDEHVGVIRRSAMESLATSDLPRMQRLNHAMKMHGYKLMIEK